MVIPGHEVHGDRPQHARQIRPAVLAVSERAQRL
jgi:hypothetical protein